MNRQQLGRWICLIALVVSGSSLWAADLTLSYTQPATTAIDWDGINDTNGDGNLTFGAQGESQNATLKVLCNSPNGYKVTFYSANATSASSSVLKNGNDQIAYTAALNTSGVQNATIVTSNLVLNSAATPSVDVNFNGAGNQLPLDGSSQSNAIQLSLTLAPFDGTLYAQGTYNDVITATISLN